MGVEHVEDEHLVLAVAEMVDRLLDPIGLVEEVGKDDDKPAPRHPLREGVERGGEVGGAAGRQALEQ